MKKNNKNPDLEKFEKRVDGKIQGNQNNIPQEEESLIFNVPDEGTEILEGGNSEIHVAEKDRKIVKRVAKIVGGTMVAGLLGWGGLTYYQHYTNKQLEKENLVEIARADSAKASETAAKIMAGENLALATTADSTRRADSLIAAKELDKKQEELDKQKRKTLDASKHAQDLEFKRINDYIKLAQRINPDFKADVYKNGMVLFQYFTADTTGKLNFSQKQRKLPINDAFFTSSDSLEANVAKLSYIKELLNREEVPVRWYDEFVGKVYDKCTQLYGRDAKPILGQDIVDKINGFNEGDEYVFKLNKGRFEGYRTIRTSPKKPDYSATEQKIKQEFKINIGNSDAAKQRIKQSTKTRKAVDPNGGKK